jgi:hypothetical protein
MAESSRIESQQAVRIAPSQTHTRQTDQDSGIKFKEVMNTSVQVLLSGMATAAGVIGGPILAAPVQELRGQIGAQLGSSSPGSAGSGATDFGSMQTLQRENQTFSMQLLTLQQEVQDENRRFTTLSNVVRAEHDTAKAAVANIRS